MVPTPVRPAFARRRACAAAAVGALSLAAGGCRPERGVPPADIPGRVAALVREQYTTRDAIAAGAWTWEPPDGPVWVLVDVQSTIPDLVRARVDLWAGDSAAVTRMARSDVMPSAAEFGAYAFEDLSGDGLPDLFGYVADSTGVSYPVFIPGAAGAMADVLEAAARGWQFATDDTALPQLVRGPGGACALQLWAEAPPDSSPAGWRYLTLDRRAGLGPPSAAAPTCP